MILKKYIMGKLCLATHVFSLKYIDIKKYILVGFLRECRNVVKVAL